MPKEFPSVILLDNSSYCNLRCSMCDYKNIAKYRARQHMSMYMYAGIIDEIADKRPSARVWEIFFGDPFCSPDMPERIEYAKQAGLTDVVLNTNGLAMRPDRAEQLIEAGLDAMYVGVDAVSQEVYSKIRVGGNLERVTSNVLAYRDLLNKKGNGSQKLFVQFVECSENEHEVDAFTKFWKDAGVLVKVRPRVSWAGLIQADNLKKDIPRTPCGWAMNSLVICADGRYALCAVDIHCQVTCGNFEEQNIEEVWNTTLRQYRDMHTEGNFSKLPAFCRDCLDWQSARCEYR